MSPLLPLLPLLLALSGSGSSIRKRAPPLPRQLPLQRALVERAAKIAAATAQEGKAELISLLDDPATRRFLRDLDDGSQLDLLSSEQLLERVRKELAIAEVVHNFGLHEDGNCGYDVTLESGIDASYFFNQWMLQALRHVPVDSANNPFVSASETRYFGYPPFANASSPDWNTSSSRLVYGALNMFRNSAGNAQCGPVAAVFSRKYIGNEAIVAPVDTGYFTGLCSNEAPAPSDYIPRANCSAWEMKRTLGSSQVATSAAKAVDSESPRIATPDSMEHLLTIFVRFYNATSIAVGRKDYPHFNLARLLTRLLSRHTYRPATASTPQSAPLLLNLFEGTLGYLEVNPAVTLQYPDSIKFMIGSFDMWFGTPEGEDLREWCISQNWPLMWAHNPLESTYICNPSLTGCELPSREYYWTGIEPTNVRLLDPYVLQRVSHGSNVTGSFDEATAARYYSFRNSSESFEKYWKHVREEVQPVKLNYTQRRVAMDPVWDQMTVTKDGLASSVLAVEPLFAGSCDNEECFGVSVVDGTCVC